MAAFDALHVCSISLADAIACADRFILAMDAAGFPAIQMIANAARGHAGACIDVLAEMAHFSLSRPNKRHFSESARRYAFGAAALKAILTTASLEPRHKRSSYSQESQLSPRKYSVRRRRLPIYFLADSPATSIFAHKVTATGSHCAYAPLGEKRSLSLRESILSPFAKSARARHTDCNKALCCATPLALQFTRDYLIISDDPARG